MGCLILLITLCLNSAGLILLRLYSETPEIGLIVLGVGYLPMSLGIFLFRNQAPLAIVGSRSPWIWIGFWSLGLATIYTLFFQFPEYLTVSQIIIAQSLMPLLAVVVTGEIFSAKAQRESVLRLLPLALLLALAGIRSAEGLGSSLTFVMVGVAFLVVQASMRKLAQVQRPLWVLPRFALTNMILLSLIVWSVSGPEVSLPQSFPIACSFAGLALVLIQGGYLVGIARTPPVLSALLISASVPISFFFEWILLARTSSPLETSLAVAYVLSVAGLSWWTQKPRAAVDRQKKAA